MLYQTENSHGGDIYGGGIALDFSANVSPLGTPRSVTDAIERALPELYRYPDPYCRTLVQTISEYEGVPKDFVLCGNGASELIYAYCGAVRPKRAMELAPTFSEYSLALRRTGCEVVRFALKQEENFDLRENFLPILAREKIDALFFCNPNNPTGALYPKEILEQIVQVARENDLILFADEIYDRLVMQGEPEHIALASLAPDLLTLCFNGLSKSHRVAGFRVGWVCLAGDKSHAKGYIEGRKVPIIVDGVTSMEHYVNPIPAGLVLTGIVVSVSVSAVMLSLTVRIYQTYRTLDMDKLYMMMSHKKRRKEDGEQ